MSFIKIYSSIAVLGLCIGSSHAADNSTNATSTASPTASAPSSTSNYTWVSPEYKWLFQFPLPIPPAAQSSMTYTNGSSSIDFYEIDIKPFEQQIYPNLQKTQLVGYNGISPGPTFKMQKGREAVVRFCNNGENEKAIHVHGQYNRSPFDGWAADTMEPGQYKDYYYPNGQNARSLWYHDHAEFITANNAYRGQEGFYWISDSQEQSLNLPSGNYDMGLAIAAKYYQSDGQLLFTTNDDAGLWGDVIHVNGQPWPFLEVEPRKYRFRVLDASVSRTYSLGLVPDGGKPISFDVIGSDAGLLSHPVSTENIMLAMGERYEIIVDFSSYKNQNITMTNGRGIGENPDHAETDKVMRFVVGDSISDNSNNGPLPNQLRNVPYPPNRVEADKNFTFARDGDGDWLINGVGFADVEHRILSKPPRGAVEVWQLANGGGGGTHPVHIHLIDFQILSRTGGRNTVLPYEAAGMKDIVYLEEGETARVLARYAPWDGIYMFHCHNLVHEDHDMLDAFNVTSLLKNWGYDNSTHFIDPMEPEFRPKQISSQDFTTDAIMQKLAWFYSTDAYDHGHEDQVEMALDAYWAHGGPSATGTGTVGGGGPVPTGYRARAGRYDRRGRV